MIRSVFITTLLALFLISCGDNTDTANSDKSTRPHDPWVFRSVLDSMPRMITIALDEDLWAAYHTNSSSLYKVWKGYVSLEGAVYNTHHGPQPESQGDAYIINEVADPWLVMKGGKNILRNVAYKGHRLQGDKEVTLMYELETTGGALIQVSERPEYALSASGQVGFERTFEVQNVPPGAEVIHQSSVASIVTPSSIKSNRTLNFINEKDFRQDEMTTLRATLQVPVLPDGASKVTAYFVKHPTFKRAKANDDVAEQDLPFGYRLIAQNDCKTCHNTNVKTIGPAYVDVAKKYPTNETTVQTLANKVIKGGAGIWGAQVMSAHPELGENDAKEMVRWILSLDPEDEKDAVASGTIGEDAYQAGAEVAENSLIPGVATKVYNIRPGTARVPDFTGQRPIMAGVMPQFNNMSGGDFKGVEDNFAISAEGYIYVEEDGPYSFRVWSDDGSLFDLHGEQLIDNDGQHGTEGVDGTVGLKKGYHPFKLRMFDSGGGQFLSLNWKKPGEGVFEVVPTQNLLHTADQRKGGEGLKLPMSVLKKTPGDGFPVAGVHPAYDLKQARPYDFLPKVGGMDFLPDGRLAVSTWDPSGAVYLVENAQSGDPNQMTYKRIAAGLAEPLGLKVVDGDIYILQKQELTKLVDTDGDDIIDEYQLVSNSWKTSSNFHEFAFGLEYDDGHFYGTLATAIMPGGASADPQIQDRGKVVKISKDKGTVQFVAQGLRTPNGIGKGPNGELFVCDNQGDWLPSSKMVHITEGAWYGSRSVDFAGTANLKETKPVVWLPQDEIGNSPATPLYINDGPYKGQMIHAEVTHGGIKRDFIEKVDGQYQGAVFRFIQGLEAGVNRMVWGPDGALYIGGVGSTGNWQQSGKLWYGLQSLKYNSTSVFEMLAIRAKSNGVEIEFTEPLKEGDGWRKSDYQIQQWEYVPTIEYGGPKVGLQSLNIRSVNVSEDRKKVFLELDGMRENRVIYVHLMNPFVSEQNHGLWSTEGWYTMNNIPTNDPGFKAASRTQVANNTLTEKEKADGWKLLFDGRTTGEWKNYGKNSIGSSWKVSNGELYLDTKKNDEGGFSAPDGGDIVTAEEYENFELEIEWKISNCGNSGIFFSVVEDDKYETAFATGPEMQILDNSCHPDTRYPTHRAGDLYDMIETKYITVNPAGEWNKVRLIKKDSKVEHWLNGHKVVEYEMYGAKWDRMVKKSKFKGWEGFGKAKSGKIALQDHHDRVAFRNIKIRRL